MYRFREKYSLQAMCAFFEVSRSGYYAWVGQAARVEPDDNRLALVLAAYQRSHGAYGYRRIKLAILRSNGININHKTVLRLMTKIGIRSIARRRKAFKKMKQLEPPHFYPNLLQRNFAAARPNQKWVTDVTYVQTNQGTLYLSVIKDLFDGFIVAHFASPENSAALVTTTIQKACQKEKVTDGLALHSDQGHQYTSHAYFASTQQYKIVPSMSRRGNCWDNAPMESFFAQLKEESLRHIHLTSFKQAKDVIDRYICFYNYERVQLKTRLTPFERRCQSP
jgi:transposase InsO family protein